MLGGHKGVKPHAISAPPTFFFAVLFTRAAQSIDGVGKAYYQLITQPTKLPSISHSKILMAPFHHNPCFHCVFLHVCLHAFFNVFSVDFQ